MGGEHAVLIPEPSEEAQRAAQEVLLKTNALLAHEEESDASQFYGQALLCAAMVLLNVYEGVLKGKAIQSGVRFHYGSITLCGGVCSSSFSLLLMAWNGNAKEHLLHADAAKTLVLYMLPALLFTMGTFIQFVCLEHLPVHIYWVLDQSRILLVAGLARVVKNTPQSWAAWNVLVSITVAAGIYVLVDALTRERSALEAAVAAGSTRGLSNTMHQEENLKVGIMMTFAGVLTMSFASVYSEIVLKDKHVAPAYVQKFFLEFNAIPVSLAATFFVGPTLEASGLKRKSSDGGAIFDGWGSHWTVLVFLIVTLRSWLVLLIVKRMNSLANLLCGVVAMALIYPAAYFHNAIADSRCSSERFICVQNLELLSSSVMACGFLVSCCVVSYTTAKRDRERLLQFHDAALALGSDAKLGSV